MEKLDSVHQAFDLLRGYAAVEDITITLGTILAVVKDQKVDIAKIVQEPNFIERLTSLIDELGIEGEYKEHMLTQFKQLVVKVPTTELVEVLLKVNQLINTEVTAYDLIIEKSAATSKHFLFSTPTSINEIATNYLLNDVDGKVTFQDGTAGVGATAVMFAEKAQEAEIDLQEIMLSTATILRIRMFLQNINARVATGDVIHNPAFTSGDRLKQYDRVFMSPPFGVRFTEEQHKVFKNDRYNRFVYGIPPRSQSEVAFLSCGLSATKSYGKAAFLLSLGVLFRSGPELEFRKRLIELDVIDAIIELPSLLQPYTSIKTALILCNKNKPIERKNKILMINAESFASNVNRKGIVINMESSKEISDILLINKELKGISKIIEAKDIDLSNMLPSRHIQQEVTFISEFGEVEVKFEVLSDITTKPLSAYVDVYRGYNAPSNDEDENGGFAILKISDIQNGAVNVDGLVRYAIKTNVKVENHRIQRGDLLLSIRGANRKSAIFTNEREDVLLSANFAGIRCNASMDPEFLQLYFESPVAQSYFEQNTEGSTVLTLSIKALKDMPIPALSLEEQREIVAKYQLERQQIQAQLKKLEQQLNEIKLNAYKAMGIDKAFTIL